MASVKSPPSLRAEQAAQTRRRILGAAAAVFEEQGFAGARIEDVAARAGVAVPTVYKVFTNKRSLLVGALNQAMSGADGQVAIDQQSWFKEQLEEPDPLRQLQLVARNARRMYERAGRLLAVLRASGPLDSGLADAWDDIAAQRLQRSRRTAKNLIAKAGNSVRMPREEVAMTLWSLTEPELFATYTAGRGTPDQYETWLGDILCRALLA
jgi:AcrR family transcriptional regulator